MDGSCIINIRLKTKEKLSKFKSKHEVEILKKYSSDRRFVSWDNTINFLLDLVNKK